MFFNNEFLLIIEEWKDQNIFNNIFTYVSFIIY
jgi:hypothetical protein